jgi:hypothetical protein
LRVRLDWDDNCDTIYIKTDHESDFRLCMTSG